jgi:hypothetical protein
MSRDGRGNPGRYELKNQPRLKLVDLLRRRKMTLKQLLDEFGISTYEALHIRCERMGVTAPTHDEFDVVMPPTRAWVNSATEGVVVVEAPPVIDEISGREIDPEAPVEAPSVTVTSEPFVPPTRPQAPPRWGGALPPTADTQKKRRGKKEDQSTEE